MFGFARKHSSVALEFYERGAIAPFAACNQTLDQLPDTFQIRTTVNIQGEEWEVLEARPATKEEFRQTGRVRLYVFKPMKMDIGSREILFGLPSISDDIAALEDTTSIENVLVMHEDEWRQREFVSLAHVDKIKAEMEAIRRICETERVGAGFRKCHVRSAIPTPLDGVHLTLSELKETLGVSHAYGGVAFNHLAAVIRMGFAFRTPNGHTLWGQHLASGEAQFVCLEVPRSGRNEQEFPDSFDALLSERRLLLVDWIGLAVRRP